MLKLVVFLIILFFLLLHFRKLERETENFVSGIEDMKIEHFADDVPDINNLKSDVKTELVDEESYAQKINDNDTEENNKENSNQNHNKKNSKKKSEDNKEKDLTSKTFNPEKDQPICQSKTKSKTGDCMFGCPDEEEEKAPIPQKIGFDEMVMTIEETEKICDLIEEKDRVRKDKEDQESLKTQLELNRKFLVQQKAQDQQIKDLEELVKSMQFTHEMNESAVAKCGKHNNDCLSDKEKKLKELLLEKEKNRKKIKINLNFKDFGKEFLEHLLNKLGLNNKEMKNLLDAINSGKLNMNDLKKQVGFMADNLEESEPGYMDDQDCPQCKVDLSEYIDRCKIPCYKCRDPKWNCPQDVNR